MIVLIDSFQILFCGIPRDNIGIKVDSWIGLLMSAADDRLFFASIPTSHTSF
jgi:hypothetical protein